MHHDAFDCKQMSGEMSFCPSQMDERGERADILRGSFGRNSCLLIWSVWNWIWCITLALICQGHRSSMLLAKTPSHWYWMGLHRSGSSHNNIYFFVLKEVCTTLTVGFAGTHRGDLRLKSQVYTHVHIHVQRENLICLGEHFTLNCGPVGLPWPWPFTCARTFLCIWHHLVDFGVSADRKASWEAYVIALASALVPALDL